MTNYGTLENGIMTPAPRAVRIGGAVVCNPTDAQYEQAGYKRVVDTPPQTDAAHYAVPTGWAEQGGEIVRKYEVLAYPPPPPRIFSKLRLYAALSSIGKWDSLRMWLESQTYNGMNAWTAFSLAQDLTEGNELFDQWLSAAKDALQIDDATAESILSQCVQQ